MWRGLVIDVFGILLARNAWEKRKLGEVATITMGQSPDSKNYTLNPQDHILVQGNADIKNGWVEPRVWTTQITKIAKKGSVLLSVRAPVGEVSKTAFDVVLGRGVASVGQTDFLYQYLITLKINGFWLRYSTGSTFDSINSADIKDAIIFLPEKNEQSRIAKTLNCIDNLIAATQHNIDALEQAKKALLQRLFDQSWRFKGYSDPWEKRKYGDIAKSFQYGLNAPAKKFDGINKYLRITDIDDHTRLFKQESLTSPDTNLSNASTYLLKQGDVLFARTGASTGKTYKYRKGDGKVYFAGFLIRADLKPKFDSEFFYQTTLTDSFLDFVKVTSQRSGQPGINSKEYANKAIQVPELSEQQRIGSVLAIYDNLIAATQSILSSLELLKKALLQDLFI